MQQKCWSLYNKEDKLRVDELTLDQVKTILLVIPHAKMGQWFACREGDLQWQGLAEVSDFYDHANQVRDPVHVQTSEGPAKKQAPRRPLFEEAPEESDSTLTVETAPLKERRSARRYVRDLLFVARVNGEKFQCKTQDVSMAGVSLEDPLPADAGKSFRAELHLDNHRVKILCHRVTDKSMKIMEADDWEALRKWLVSW